MSDQTPKEIPVLANYDQETCVGAIRLTTEAFEILSLGKHILSPMISVHEGKWTLIAVSIVPVTAGKA